MTSLFGNVASQSAYPVSVRTQGATGGGIADDSAAFIAADILFDSYYVPPGTYKIGQSITLTKTVVFARDAILVPTGVGVVINMAGKIDAGFWQIFNTSDNFVTTPWAAPSVVIQSDVKADWFGATKVNSLSAILTIPDQVPNILKAWRAATGAYVTNVGTIVTRLAGQFAGNNLIFDEGCYRLDTPISFGTSDGTNNYYHNGTGHIGKGLGSSYLVLTDLNNTSNAAVTILFGSYEPKLLNNLQITAYNPSSGTPFSSRVGAMLLISSCDSMVIDNLWTSGAQISVNDANGVKRNGVGLQIDSCVDIQCRGIFSEHNVRGFCVYSSVVTVANLNTYANSESDIGLGNFIAAYPLGPAQNSPTNLTINGIESKACTGKWCDVISTLNTLNVTGGYANATADGGSAAVGTTIINLYTSAGLSGNVDKVNFINYVSNAVLCPVGSVLGGVNGSFTMKGCSFTGIVSSALNNGVFNVANTTSEFAVYDCFINNCFPAIYSGSALKAIFKNISLRSFTGKVDNSGTNQIFVVLGGEAWFEKITRQETLPTVQRFGFVSATGKVHADDFNCAGTTRSIFVTAGGSATMNSQVAFV